MVGVSPEVPTASLVYFCWCDLGKKDYQIICSSPLEIACILNKITIKKISSLPATVKCQMNFALFFVTRVRDIQLSRLLKKVCSWLAEEFQLTVRFPIELSLLFQRKNVRKHFTHSIVVAIIDKWSSIIITSILISFKVCWKSMSSLKVIDMLNFCPKKLILLDQFICHTLFDNCIKFSTEYPYRLSKNIRCIIDALKLQNFLVQDIQIDIFWMLSACWIRNIKASLCTKIRPTRYNACT